MFCISRFLDEDSRSLEHAELSLCYVSQKYRSFSSSFSSSFVEMKGRDQTSSAARFRKFSREIILIASLNYLQEEYI